KDGDQRNMQHEAGDESYQRFPPALVGPQRLKIELEPFDKRPAFGSRLRGRALRRFATGGRFDPASGCSDGPRIGALSGVFDFRHSPCSAGDVQGTQATGSPGPAGTSKTGKRVRIKTLRWHFTTALAALACHVRHTVRRRSPDHADDRTAV